MSANSEKRKTYNMNFRFKKSYILYILFLALISFFAFKSFSKPKSFTLMPEESVNINSRGAGLFVFYEYPVKAFEGLDFSKSNFNDEERYRPGSQLIPLDENMRKRAENYLKSVQETIPASGEEATKEEAKTDKTGEKNLDKEFKDKTSIFRPSFSLKPNENPHQYPLLGDSSPVIDPNDPKNSWETKYLQRVLSGGYVLSGPYGRVIKSLDGFENLISPPLLLSIMPGEIERGKFTNNKLKGLKFVEDRHFYLVMDLEDAKSSENFKQGRNYEIELEDGNKIEGVIDLIRSDKEGGKLFIFSIRTGYEKVKDKRFQDVKLYGPSVNAFRLPMDCLANDGEKSYCYKLNFKNRAQRVNVNLVKVEDNYALVQVPEEEKKNGDLSSYDRVLFNPQSVKEGQMY